MTSHSMGAANDFSQRRGTRPMVGGPDPVAIGPLTWKKGDREKVLRERAGGERPGRSAPCGVTDATITCDLISPGTGDGERHRSARGSPQRWLGGILMGGEGRGTESSRPVFLGLSGSTTSRTKTNDVLLVLAAGNKTSTAGSRTRVLGHQPTEYPPSHVCAPAKLKPWKTSAA